MPKTTLLRILAATALILAVGMPVLSLDLPVKRVNGKQYYYHKVKKGESLYGISKNIGLPVEEIVRNNPALADGVKKGDILVFPYDEYHTPEPAEAAPDDVAQETVILNPIEIDDSVAVKEVATRPATIGVLLPFGLEAGNPAIRNRLALDFYRGFLIAADSLSERPGDIAIVARDTEGLDADALKQLIETDTLLQSAAVIIGPDDDNAISAISAAASRNETYTLNVLNTRDSLYLISPYMLQANTPQKQMYKLAVDGLRADFPQHKPVILRNTSGTNDREAFTLYLTERYRAEGVEPIVIEYSGNLVAADLDILPTAAGEKYVVIPSSGSVNEFNRFAYTLRNFRDRLRVAMSEPDEAGNLPEAVAEIEVFGYPDWTAFRGEALEVLHRLEATVYSRFFDDDKGFGATNIRHAFDRWYGTEIMESVPIYAILGFDCGTYLIKNLRRNEGEFEAESALPYSGIQSTFDFVKTGRGYANNSIYIITYQAGGRLSAHVQ